MVAVIDIGNSNLHYGVGAGKRLCHVRSYPRADHSVIATMIGAMKQYKADGVAVASVVPSMTREVVRMIKDRMGLRSLIVSSKVDSGLRLMYRTPETLGADRISNVVGGLTRYRRNLIVVDFGTAITLDVALKGGVYLGGVIMPGVRSAEIALTQSTAMLKKVPFQPPKSTIGRSTRECIQSGLFYGTVHAVDGLIKDIKRTTKRRYTCVATGGWGRTVSQHCSCIDQYDKDITLYGILKIYQMNTK